MTRKALVIGATGATGRALVAALLQNPGFSSVETFVRRRSGIPHAKLTEHVIDFADEKAWSHLVAGDALFSALGTTLKAAGSKEAQWAVDYTAQLAFARAARANGVPSYVLISSIGANPDSGTFYLRMKGQLDREVSALGFERAVILQPPALIRDDLQRESEKLSLGVLKLLNAIGLARAWRPMRVTDLAQAMIAASEAPEGTWTIAGERLRKLAGEGDRSGVFTGA